jgi:CMP-N,N'-diacetyllegionaminic acid synthase
MISDKRVLGLIPARGGSKAIPRKNIHPLAGKPLLAWTIEEARKAKSIDRLVLSSDDAEIIAEAKRWGCEVPFVRPAELAQDATPGIDPVLHALKELPGFDYVVLLQPTSPLRTAEDIEGTIERCVASRAPACVSVTATNEHPALTFKVGAGHALLPLLPESERKATRQEYPQLYRLSGAVYVARTEWLLRTRTFVTSETIAYVAPAERSVDIDDPMNLLLAEVLLTRRLRASGDHA